MFGGSSSSDILGSISKPKNMFMDVTGSSQPNRVLDTVRGKTSWSEGLKSGGASALRGGFGVGFGAHYLSADTTRSAINKLFKSGDDKAPAVNALPGQGANNIGAKAKARQRALEAQKKRFGISDTVATTPLGLVGGDISLGKKRLIGE